MNRKILNSAFLILGVFYLTGCAAESPIVKLSESKNNIEIGENKSKPDKIEVFLFHTTQRCATCIAIGKLSGETIYEYFQSELRDGKIEFREINIDSLENKELAQKFQASGSALFINTIYNGQDNISQDTQVWRLTQNEVQFKSYLRNRINNLLNK
ncbi:MAG: nitrophenyl compound nitroreductase subunit ArsF family protein [Patescibacteria group bacterium]|jgi:thiol-disulfide isomerase/thioredoxin